MTRSIKKWSDEADAKLQDCFAAQTKICSDSSEGIEEYTTSVTVFINKCIEDVVPTVTVHTYPNQKPWITGNIHTELKGRAATFKVRDSNPEAYKKSCYALRQTIRQEKRQYRAKIVILLHRPRRSSYVAWLANYYRLKREAKPRAAQ